MNAASTPAIDNAVEVLGKTSMATGGAIYTAEKVMGVSWTMTEYAAMVSIVGGLVWIAKMLFDSFISWLKYKRGD